MLHPSRRRIVEHLAVASDGATVFDIADAVGLHHNAVRSQLATLAKAGVVWSERPKANDRPGRPRIVYRLVAVEDVAADAGRKELFDMLLRIVVRARVSEVEVEAVGMEEGRRLAATGAKVVTGFIRGGFAPEDVTTAEQAKRGESHLILRHCPFAEAVKGPEGAMVCVLHRGIARGLLSATGGELIELVPTNPDAPACRVSGRLGTTAAE